MKCYIQYVGENGHVYEANSTEEVPATATGLVKFIAPPAPPPPHSEEDHALIKSHREEFFRLFERIHGYKPGGTGDASSSPNY